MNRFKIRALSFLLTLALLVGMLLAGAWAAEPVSGDNAVYKNNQDTRLRMVRSDEAIEIATADDLKLLSNAAAGSRFVLTADITLPADWEPVEFGGTLDGMGYTVTMNGKPVFKNLNSGSVVSNLVLVGSVESDSTHISSLTTNFCGGTVRNCISYANVTYTGSAGGSWSPRFVAGLVAQFSAAGLMDNCVYAGTVNQGSAEAWGSLANIAMAVSAEIKNCIGVGSDRIGSLEGLSGTSEIAVGSNTLIANANDFDPANYVDQLNGNRDVTAGDLEWEVVDGRLSLKRGAEAPEATEQEIAALQNAIDTKTADTGKVYTADSWTAYTEALGRAQSVLQQEKPKQDAVVNALSGLNAAFAGLTERSLAAVDLAGKEVISITAASQLDSLTAGKYYRLDTDIEITGTWFGTFESMNAVLDGNGHTITLNTSNHSHLWSSLGPDAIVQNLGIKGNVTYSSASGAIANSSQGLIVNCWSLADVTPNGSGNAGGLVGELRSGGAISNSWVAGSVSGKVGSGSLAGSAEANSLIQSCYGLINSFKGTGEGQVQNCAVKARKDFYSPEFIALLNQNRGTYGREWTLSAEGYPHLGEAQSYTPPEALTVTFTYNDGRTVSFNSDEGLTVSLQDASGYAVGSFAMAGVARWQDTIVGNKDVLLVTENGNLSIYKAGSADVVGISSEAEGSKELVRFTVTVAEGDAVDGFRLTLGGNDVGDSLTLQGSEQVTLIPEILKGANWSAIAPSQVEFAHTGALHRVNGTIYAEAPGEMTLTAKYMDKEATVNIVSEFVPVTSIVPSPSGEYVIHQRNTNAQPLGAFINLSLSHGAGTVTVLPENASYRDRWTLSSSDNEVAEYVASMLVAVLPKKAGSVTLTAVVEADGQQPRVEGSSRITIKYANPVASVSMDESSLTVKENQEAALPLSFSGPKSAEGLRVTEPAMSWSFSGEGEVRIATDGSPIVTEQLADGNLRCEANDRYKLVGVKAGEVKVVGTPLDRTLNAGPVEFTVVVEPGEALAPADNHRIAAEGIAGAQGYLTANAPAAYRYGNEWEIFALRRSGQSIDPAKLAAYLDSVEAAYRYNPGNTETKPTTIARVVLTLGVLGENAADFRGLDFIEMLCNSERTGEGGNEPMWTLLALDSRDFVEPAGALWTRDKLATELILQYQNPEGGFGLTDNVTASADMTAMAVQALAPYYESRQDVREAVDRALLYLQGKMSPDCGFDGNAEAAAQAVVALAALNRSPVAPENGFAPNLAVNMLTNISSFAAEGGGFKHYAADRGPQIMSTTQALLAFESYRRMTGAENFIYDLSDVNRLAMLEQRLSEAERLQENLYTGESWQALQAAAAAAKQLLAGEYTEASLKAADEALAAAIAGLKLLNPDSKPTPGPDTKMITVSFRLIGDSKHEGDGHDKYINWIKTMNVSVPADSTVYDVLLEALGQKGMDFTEGQDGYISSIQAPSVLGGFWLSEFDNGPSSGWKYLVNGKYPNVSLRYYWPKNGDSIIWRYVDDYTDGYDDANKWQEAADIDPNPGMSQGGGAGVSGEKTSVLAPEANIDKNGAANAAISYKDVTDAVARAQKDEAASITVMPQNTGKATDISVSLQVDSAKDIVKAALGLNVETKQGSLAIPEKALAAIAEQAGGADIRINVAGRDTKAEAVKAAMESALRQAAASMRSSVESLLADAGVTEVTITSGTKEISSFGGQELTINLPVPVGSKGFAKDNNYKVVVVSSDGTVEVITGKCLLVGGQLVVQVKVSHLSTFIVTAEKEQAVSAMSFGDVPADSWFYGAVRFVYEAGLMQGEGENTFNPNGKLSRAMLVTILYRLEQEPAVGRGSMFSDVGSGQWYTEAVSWAAEKGIVNGYEDGRFGPNGSVTREEMAAMLMRYAEFKHIDTSAAGNISSYRDGAKVSAWAEGALSWAGSVGLIQGDDNNSLNPQGQATRAETATILQRLVEAVLK